MWEEVRCYLDVVIFFPTGECCKTDFLIGGCGKKSRLSGFVKFFPTGGCCKTDFLIGVDVGRSHVLLIDGATCSPFGLQVFIENEEKMYISVL
jgi:hypothetical protein